MRKNGFSYKGNKPRFVWETLPIYPNDHEKFRRIEKAKNYKEKPRGNIKTNSKYTEECCNIDKIYFHADVSVNH